MNFSHFIYPYIGPGLGIIMINCSATSTPSVRLLPCTVTFNWYNRAEIRFIKHYSKLKLSVVEYSIDSPVLHEQG